MKSDRRDKRLKEQVDIQSSRLKKAEQERASLLAEAAALGVLGLLFVLPVVAGAYLGRWLDGMAEGYSLRWTLSLIFLGLIVGAVNVYWYLKE